MKKALMVFFTILLLNRVVAQDMRDGYHITNFPVQVFECKIDGTPVGTAPGNQRWVKANWKFRIVNVIGTDYIISLTYFPSSFKDQQNLNETYFRKATGEEVYYKLTEASYKLNAERLERRGNFTVGASTTLIKIRPGKKTPKDGYNIYSEFGNDFNIGVSAGWKFKPYRRQQLAYSFVGGLSFSSIKVTPYTTKEFVESESAQSCITLSVGFVFEYNKFQVSAFSGYDMMSGEVGRHWIYRNRPWIGLGFGYQIFRAEGEKNQVNGSN